MRNKKILVVVLLAVSFWFVSGAGYGEIKQWVIESKASVMEVALINTRISYLMLNPDNFLNVYLLYDQYGSQSHWFAEDVSTVNKIIVFVKDTRGRFFGKPGRDLLALFQAELVKIFPFLDSSVATNMDTDILAVFLGGDNVILGYFYQGEYHLREE